MVDLDAGHTPGKDSLFKSFGPAVFTDVAKYLQKNFDFPSFNAGLNGKGLDAVIFEQHYQTPHIETGIQGFFINEELIPVENKHQGRDDVQQVDGAPSWNMSMDCSHKGVVGLVHHRSIEHQGNGSPELGELFFVAVSSGMASSSG
jgi:hypothetical protein